MLILTIRTDKPEAEIGLYDNQKRLAYKKWQAHRKLSSSIHQQIVKLLESQEKSWDDIQGIVCFKGPGSFTGLRIGLSVANTLAYGLQIPIVATSDNWIKEGIDSLLKGKTSPFVIPEYGQPVHTTSPRK